MARQVLDNGIVLPSEYSDDWYDDMTSNLTKLDEVIGSDAEKLDESDVGAAAISNDYDDLDNKPTYNILRRASVTLTAGGTGNYSDLDSDSKIKAGDYVLDAANKLYSITAIDAANSTYTVSAAALFTVTDKAELGAAALSNDYDDLNNLPGYGILRFCSTAITDNSSVPFANISSVSKIAAGDFLLDTAAKLYTVSAVDTANETVSVTTPLTQLAVDANVMHLSGNETADGQKTFSNMSSFQGSYLGSETSTNARTDLVLESNRDTHGQSGIYITKFRQNKAQGGLTGNDVVYLTLDLLENSVRTNTVFRFNFRNFVNDIPQDIGFYPTGSKNSLGGAADGASNNKWHLFNGINPGALSLPDLNNGIDISGYINVRQTSQYTAPADGYISISCHANTTNVVCIKDASYDYGTVVRAYQPLTPWELYAVVPVIKNHTYTIIFSCQSFITLDYARFFPCQGNV